MKRNILAICALAATASLMAQSYQVVVTTKDGEKKVIAADDITDIKFANAPQYIKAGTFIEGLYSPNATNATYDFTIATEEPDAEGQPSAVGGVQLSLSMNAPLSDEAQNAILPEGYYRIGNGESYTFTPSGSAVWIRFDEGADDVAVGYVVGGTVDVKHDNGNYDIRAELDLLDGTQIAVAYYGDLKFRVGASGSVDFEEDQDVQFTEGQGRVWANWFNPFCDDGSLQFFTGRFDAGGAQLEGYCLYLSYYMPKDDIHTSTWKPVVTDGVYNVDPRERITGQTYLPYTLMRGSKMEMFGQATAVGSYLTYLAADGRVSLATIKEGTLTVSDGGTKFVFDFVADNGIKITGSYDKKPYIVNYINNSNQPECPDNLTGDYTFSKWADDAVILDDNLGDYIIQGLNSHVIIISDPKMTKGDYLSIDVFSEGDQIKDGTYTIDNSLQDMTGLKGYVNFQGGMAFSWYGDLDSTDEEGYQSILAPVCGGSFTVTTLDNGQRKFDFDLRDLKGNKMTGSITRNVHYASESDQAAAKVERSHARALGQMKRSWGSNRTDAAPRQLIRK